MKNYKKVFVIPLLIAIVALLGISGGAYVYINKKPADKFENSLKEISINPETTTANENEVPNIIKAIIINPETGSQSAEIDFQIEDQVKNNVLNDKLSWFKDPVEVSKRYGDHFGITSNFQYSLKQAASWGGDSGLTHSTVLATNSIKSYEIYLISKQSQPYIWLINGVNDLQQSNKLRVVSVWPTSTDGISRQELIKKFGDGSTLFYLNVKKPIVTFSLNQPVKQESVSSDSIIVKINNTILNGAKVKVVTEQGAPNGETLPMYSIRVDLSDISNLKDYTGQNIQIILTDKIKDNSGNPLQQCDRSYNIGECIADASGQKVKAFGVELKLYSFVYINKVAPTTTMINNNLNNTSSNITEVKANNTVELAIDRLLKSEPGYITGKAAWDYLSQIKEASTSVEYSINKLLASNDINQNILGAFLSFEIFGSQNKFIDLIKQKDIFAIMEASNWLYNNNNYTEMENLISSIDYNQSRVTKILNHCGSEPLMGVEVPAGMSIIRLGKSPLPFYENLLKTNPTILSTFTKKLLDTNADYNSRLCILSLLNNIKPDGYKEVLEKISQESTERTPMTFKVNLYLKSL